MNGRRLRPTSDKGSIMVYLLISMVGLALGALLVPMIVTSAGVTRSDTSRLQAIDAARAGTNVMLGKIRAAQTSSGIGTSTLLPCTTVTGTVNGSGDQSYSATVSYYLDDPVTTSGATAMTCVAGSGTYDSTTGTFTPRYARITAVGKAGSGAGGTTPGRTLVSTYTLKSSNTNTLGGQIKLAANTTYCLDAGSATPTSGTVAKLQTCATPATAQQVWAYRSDLTLQLVSSVTSAVPLGMCIDTSAAPTSGNNVVINPCQDLGSPTYTEQWSYGDAGYYQVSKATSASTGTLSGLCMAPPSASAGVAVVLTSCSGSYVGWQPDASVGPGAATATLAFGTTQQLVNYNEFGRCLDVTNQDVSSAFLIDYPCKQNPYAGAVTWNQKWTTPAATTTTSATGWIYTTVPAGTKYCLTSTGTDGGYVTVAVCSSTNTKQNWTLTNGDSSLSYTSKYRIVDYTGNLCLARGDPASGYAWSTIVSESCSGATEQKWNATADLTASSLTNITENAS